MDWDVIVMCLCNIMKYNNIVVDAYQLAVETNIYKIKPLHIFMDDFED